MIVIIDLMGDDETQVIETEVEAKEKQPLIIDTEEPMLQIVPTEKSVVPII